MGKVCFRVDFETGWDFRNMWQAITKTLDTRYLLYSMPHTHIFEVEQREWRVRERETRHLQVLLPTLFMRWCISIRF